MSYHYGRGALSGEFGPLHEDMPFRQRAVPLRDVNSLERAKDYAAGGYHVAVDRSAGGGCQDHWSIHKGGTVAVACTKGLNNSQLFETWSNTATRYKEAFDAAAQGRVLSHVKDKLRIANITADSAFMAEGLVPPKAPRSAPEDPPPSSMDTVVSQPSFGLPEMGFLALGGFLLTKAGKKGKGRRVRRAPRRRGRRRR